MKITNINFKYPKINFNYPSFKAHNKISNPIDTIEIKSKEFYHYEKPQITAFIPIDMRVLVYLLRNKEPTSKSTSPRSLVRIRLYRYRQPGKRN